MNQVFLIAIGLSCACSSETQSASMDLASANGDMAQSGGSQDLASGRDMAQLASLDMARMSGSIPDPGTVMSTGSIFIDPTDSQGHSNEPNDTPAQATPLGIVTPDNTGTVLLWVTQNTFTATDQSDYAVFTAATAGTFQLGSAGVCGSATNVLGKIDLWKVTGGQQVTPPVQEWTAAAGATCIPGTAPILANTEYLIGFFGAGTPGSYSA